MSTVTLTNVAPVAASTAVQASLGASYRILADDRLAATALARAALAQRSFLDFVRYFTARDIKFQFCGGRPNFVLGGHTRSFQGLKLMPELRAAFARWEGLNVRLEYASLQRIALELRFEWMRRHHNCSDLACEMPALMNFVAQLGRGGVMKAIMEAMEAKTSDHATRVAKFMSVCHAMIEGRAVET